MQIPTKMSYQSMEQAELQLELDEPMGMVACDSSKDSHELGITGHNHRRRVCGGETTAQ